MPSHEAIDGRQHGESDLRLARRRKSQQDQERRQQHEAERERHDHAEAGNGSELGHADIAGRQESEEARADRRRRQRQRPSDAGARLGECRRAVGLDQPLGQRADAELNAEIDAKAHEKRNEGHRQEVEATDHQQADGGGQNEADQRRERDRQNDADRPHGQPQDAEQGHEHGAEDEMGVLGQRGKLLVGQGYRSGQANGHAMRLIKPERLRDGADRVARRGARLQGGIVHHRLNQQDMPCLAEVGRLPAGEKRAPREEGRAPSHGVLERFRKGRQRRFDVFWRDLALLETLQYVGHDDQGAAQARIGGQPRQEGRRPYKATRRRLDVGQRREQQSFALEEGTSVGPAHGLKKILPLLQACRQTPRGVIGKLRRGAIDDNHGEVVELRERRFEGELFLTPFQPLRDQLGCIGRHRKILGNEEQRRDRKACDREQHNQGVPGTGRHNAANRQNPGRQNASQERMRPAANSRDIGRRRRMASDYFVISRITPRHGGAVATTCRALGNGVDSAVARGRQYVWFVFGSWCQRVAGAAAYSVPREASSGLGRYRCDELTGCRRKGRPEVFGCAAHRSVPWR